MEISTVTAVVTLVVLYLLSKTNNPSSFLNLSFKDFQRLNYIVGQE